MFEIINDKRRYEIKWWMVPSAALMFLLLGINIGILIGRRDADPSDWLQVVFLLFVSLAIVWPVIRELMARQAKEKNTDVH